MISRNRSTSTAAAMSIECTTSANSTVTCLYSADRVADVTGMPHSLQNLTVAPSCVPHDTHDNPAVVSPSPHPRWDPRQYRFNAGQRRPTYRRAICDLVRLVCGPLGRPSIFDRTSAWRGLLGTVGVAVRRPGAWGTVPR